MITKNLTKGTVTIICLLLFLQPNNSFGQWHYRELPGLTTGPELLTHLIIIGSGGIIMLLIPSPKPELHIKRSNLIKKDNSFSFDHDQSLVKLRSFSKVCWVRVKSPNRSMFGTIRSVEDRRFVMETSVDSVEVPYTRLKDVYDLPSAAKAFKNGRIGVGIFMSSFAAAFFYDAVIADHPIEGASRALSWATFSGFGALAAYTFIHKTDAEKEYKIWQEEFANLSTPGKGENSQRPNSKIGLKFGLNFAHISGKNLADTNSKIGFIAGGYFLHNLYQIYPSVVAIQPEVLFSMKGYKQQFQSFRESIDVSLTLVYLEIPILARLSIPQQANFTPHLLIGPAVAVKLGSRAQVDGESRDVQGVETIDFGMILGAGGRLSESPLNFEIRYNLGLKSNFEGGNIKNRAFSVMLGYSL